MRIQAVLMVAASASDGRLFGLDLQLVHDAVITGINIFILFLVLSYLLFNPVTELLKKRRQKIQSDLDQAETDRSEAKALKENYDQKLRGIMAERDEILSEARKMGQKTQESMLAEAKEDAQAMKQRAKSDIELQRKHAADDMKKEMIDLASVMAGKVVSAQIDTHVQDQLVDDTLKEIGEDTWQN